LLHGCDMFYMNFYGKILKERNIFVGPGFFLDFASLISRGDKPGAIGRFITILGGKRFHKYSEERWTRRCESCRSCSIRNRKITSSI